MTAVARVRTGVALSAFVGLFMIGASAVPKFIDWPGKAAMIAHLGLSPRLLPIIGVLEIAVTVVYLVPRTSFLGAVLLTGFLGGAVVTHVRIGDPWWFPLLIGALAWAGLGLRRPVVGRLLAGGDAADARQAVAA